MGSNGCEHCTKCSWRQVPNGVQQGLRMVLVLFNLFISELDDGKESTPSASLQKLRSDRHTVCVCCHPEGDGKAGELGKQDKGNQQVLYLCRNNCRHQCKLGDDHLESRLAESSNCKGHSDHALNYSGSIFSQPA